VEPPFLFLKRLVHPFVDYRIILHLWRLGIPIAIYYRDAYWKFSDYFHSKGMKRLELVLRYRTDLALFSKVSTVMFFPTASLAGLFLKLPWTLLPPGGEVKETKRESALEYPLKAVYVGGVTERHGIGILLGALQRINRHKVLIHLDLVCCKNELRCCRTKSDVVCESLGYLSTSY